MIPEEERVKGIIENIERKNNYSQRVDIANSSIKDDGDFFAKFDMSEFRKHCLINRFDDIGPSLMKQSEINSYEETRLDFRDRSALGPTFSGKIISFAISTPPR